MHCDRRGEHAGISLSPHMRLKVIRTRITRSPPTMLLNLHILTDADNIGLAASVTVMRGDAVIIATAGLLVRYIDRFQFT